MRTTCRACSGTKVIIKQYCGECKGKGKMIFRKKVVVPVPAGKRNKNSYGLGIQVENSITGVIVWHHKTKQLL